MFSARTKLLSVLVLLAAGCKTEESFQVRVMRPAPIDLWHYDLVAVDRFSGQGSEVLSQELSDALRNATNPLTGKSDFTIIDRREVDRALDDPRSRRGNDFDDYTKEILDRWRSAEIVIRGNVDNYQVWEEVVEHPWVDPHGIKHVTYTRSCTAELGVMIEATDVDGERTFDDVRYDEVAQAATKAVDATPDAIDHDSMLTEVRRRVVQRYMNRVMPHEEWVSVRLYTDGDLPELAVGNGFARAGDWAEALRSYEDARERAVGDLAEVRFKAIYNIGIALQYTDRFADATKALKEAYAMSQDERILNELHSVRAREQDAARRREQSRQEPAQPPRSK